MYVYVQVYRRLLSRAKISPHTTEKEKERIRRVFPSPGSPAAGTAGHGVHTCKPMLHPV